jgi:AraC-like DNA-binding protein
VERDEPAPRGVQRLLPELRASVQVHTGDRFWLRQPARAWHGLPRVGLWTPRTTPWDGYATGRVRAFALSLTSCGMRALRLATTTGAPGSVLDLQTIDEDLASGLDCQPGESFAVWMHRAVALLAIRLRSAPQPDELDRALTSLAQMRSVSECASEAGLSEGHFRRRFAQRHGYSPKTYQRIVRVDRLIRRLHDSPWETDPGPAHDDGFSDQAHAIREFRAVTGLTPGEYRRRKRGSDLSLRSVRIDEELPQADLPGLSSDEQS